MLVLLLLIVGLLLLAWGAKWFVQGSSGISEKLSIPPVIIGLTVVSLGTGSPEIVVTVMSSLIGESDLAVGNVLGSNLCNTLLILGLAALVRPLRIHQQIVNKDLLVMVGVTLLAFFLSLTGELTRWDGILLLLSAALYLIYLIRRAKKGDVIEEKEKGTIPKNLFWMIFQVIGGLGLLVFGGEMVINNAITIANHLGISPLIIGMTIVAVGTSLPELATSLFATYKGELDIAVGNVVGSNIFNLLVVLGLAAVLAPEPIAISKEALYLDFPVVIYSALLCLPIFFSANRINRIEGGTLLLTYALYIAFVVINLSTPLSPLIPLCIGIVLFFLMTYLALQTKKG